MRNPYEILGVKRTANEAEIKSAYRTLAKKLHPDVDPDNPRILERFKEVTAAYETLKDPERRRDFDSGKRQQDAPPRRPRGPRAWNGTNGTANGANGHGTDGAAANGHDAKGAQTDSAATAAGRARYKDIFSEILGGLKTAAGEAAPAPETALQNARDRVYKLKIGFVEAAAGTTRRLRLSADRRIDVKIPAGIQDGQQVRLKGAGPRPEGGGTAGDALIAIEVEPHPFFTRKGADIVMELPMSLTEAVLGGRIKVPTIHGPVQISIPPGSNTGTTLRLKGRGMQLEGEGLKPGDQYVTLKIMLPDNPPKDFVRTIKRWSEKWTAPVRKGMGYE